MLKEIRLKNFKCFREETTFPLSTINLLTGINGRGKSTLLQSMLLMKQSVEHNEYTNKLILNGSCVNLGTYEDLQNSESALEEEVEIEFNSYLYDDNTLYNLEIYYKILSTLQVVSIKLLFNMEYEDKKSSYEDLLELIDAKGNYSNSIVKTTNVYRARNIPMAHKMPSMDTRVFIENSYLHLIGLLPYISEAASIVNDAISTKDDNSALEYKQIEKMNFYNKIHYTAADRLGSQEYYKKINLNDFISVDKKGENLATVIFELKENLVNDKLYLGKDAKNLEQQVGEWLSQIFDTKVEIEVIDNSYTFELLFTINGKTHKPTNVGFGYSYILPIIVSGLIAKEGEILIIENPEAHLHPKAQSELTKFLAKVASCGVQIFIESHSEHILNGLRVAIIEEEFEITNEDVNVLYFHDNEDSYFTKIPIKPNGKIEVRKEGFFDQTTKDLDTILGL